MTTQPPAPLIFLVAGEPSGDVLGARLMAALKERTGGAARFAGVGGERMIAEGIESLFPMADLSVMGYLEVVPRIPQLLARLRQAAAAARAVRPDAVVTIDSPEFSLRLARRLAGAGAPLIHYVAPQVWAHRPGRAAGIARLLDHLMTLLPFEPPYFERFGLPCSFVGHAVVEEGADRGDGPGFRARHDIAPEATIVCALPGSRRTEVERHLPVFGAALGLLASRIPALRVVVPTVGAVASEVAAQAARWPVDATVVTGRRERHDAFAAATVALAASGTVALELAIAGLPTVIAYKVNPLTAWAVRRMMQVPYVSLVNLILDRPVTPELLQERCRPDLLADAVGELLGDAGARETQRIEARRAAEAIGLGGPSPSVRAAEVVLDVIAGKAGKKGQKKGA